MDIFTDTGTVVVAGDWHGDISAPARAVEAAWNYGADLIVHLGDFGFHWPGDHGKFEDYTNLLLKEAAMSMIVVEGNHENHDYLAGLPDHPNFPGFGLARDNIWHARRGALFTINGVKCGALGGAFSIDYRHRTLGVSWWHEEEPTLEQAKPLLDAELDILFTHDAPIDCTPPSMFRIPEFLERRSAHTRRLIQRVVYATEPQLVVHGHWHQGITQRMASGGECVGLADSTAPRNLGLLHLDTLNVEYLDT